MRSDKIAPDWTQITGLASLQMKRKQMRRELPQLERVMDERIKRYLQVWHREGNSFKGPSMDVHMQKGIILYMIFMKIKTYPAMSKIVPPGIVSCARVTVPFADAGFFCFF